MAKKCKSPQIYESRWQPMPMLGFQVTKFEKCTHKQLEKNS